MLVVEAVSLWKTRRVFQGLWEGGEAGFPQAVRVTARSVMRRRSGPVRNGAVFIHLHILDQAAR